jgi:hypothetical protein
MERVTQTVEDVLDNLSALPSTWRDNTADKIIAYLNGISERSKYTRDDLQNLLDQDFDTAMTVFRLFLEKSSDEFKSDLRALFGKIGGIGKKAYEFNREHFLDSLDRLLISTAITTTVNHAYGWRDILVERLKAGRGSAIKGQGRGRALEDYTESIVKKVFGDGCYDKRCSFIGRSGQSTEKADFAVPSKNQPRLLIEVKAYGATGSKQTDVLGDIERIIGQKRRDAVLLLVADGITWSSRVNDLRKLIKLQNDGDVYRIYTRKMGALLESDLNSFKREQKL